MKVKDIAQAINPNGKFKIIGIRAGEKIHEQMIGTDDANYTYEFKDYYKILPFSTEFKLNKKYIKNGKKVKSNFIYSSDSNKNWMKLKNLKQWLISNKEKNLNLKNN